ncbi:MAG: hypothetical protein COU11_03470 [Candidatus Harrisonbacteria bacterium CG10_big_fil_rev_8_21_14_0_10_49_15]|uniref:Antitoxin n=1 Tax=Candidatus Harrisonbacteria bacterium CG10_big_fil_rev_8_21_14_0_10_49_15 TaxID=1974587 RepID=A0A2H0UKJ1_9BACT|nr:MAG: hypothetical protein COU11_03470 [Candidatus Harrisonbacteria bacterium CG10_big_fil_rev_8_21_14_0_10_49_15]
MKYIKLDAEEKKIEKDFAAGKYKPVKNLKKEMARYQAVARETLNKTRSINIRISNRSLQRLKAAAIREGLPYQTLISSILHKYSEGRDIPANSETVAGRSRGGRG